VLSETSSVSPLQLHNERLPDDSTLTTDKDLVNIATQAEEDINVANTVSTGAFENVPDNIKINDQYDEIVKPLTEVDAQVSLSATIESDWQPVNVSGEVYWWNVKTNETTEVGAPNPAAALTSESHDVENDGWEPVIDESSGDIYWWNVKTGETSEIGVQKPVSTYDISKS